MNYCCENCGWSEIVGSPIMCNYNGHRTWRNECCEAWKPKEAEATPTVGGWISVKDRLPEENGEYLISTKDRVTSAYYECGRRTSEWTDYYEGYIDFEPTHWMPLPEPPKEDDDANKG